MTSAALSDVVFRFNFSDNLFLENDVDQLSSVDRENTGETLIRGSVFYRAVPLFLFLIRHLHLPLPINCKKFHGIL